MKNNGIIKISRNEDFTMCQNDIIRHVGEGMSAKALGVYMVIKYYISIPNFVIHKDHIQRVSGEGKKAFETVWKELKELGYIKQERKRTSEGKWAYEYTLFTSKEEVIENKKASSTAIDEAPQTSTSINNSYNKSIPQKDKKDTKKIKKDSEILQVIKDSCVSIREEHLKECEELFTDINRLKLALEICENNNSNGIKALKLAYKKAYTQNNNSNDNFTNNFSKGAGSGVNNNFAKYGNDLEAMLQKSQEGKFKDMEQGISQFNPSFKL
jgi:hypothetical protein